MANVDCLSICSSFWVFLFCFVLFFLRERERERERERRGGGGGGRAGKRERGPSGACANIIMYACIPLSYSPRMSNIRMSKGKKVQCVIDCCNT